MNCLALITLLLATPLVQSDSEGHGCKAALNELAVSAHAAVLATETADNLVVRVDDLGTKLDSCRKEGKRVGSCSKLEAGLKAAEAELDEAEEELTVALEAVDSAYDGFDIACSWEEPAPNVQVRYAKPRRQMRSSSAQTVARSAPRASRAR